MPQQDYAGQIVWIVGASSGIGAATAHELATRGATLVLSARRRPELLSLVTTLGADHRAFDFDVTDAASTLRTAQDIVARFGRIDRIIFLAATYTPMTMDKLDLVQLQDMITINLVGAFNLAHAALAVLKKQPMKSQLALCASVAGYMGLPGGQPYSATKAALINLAESLYAECGDKIDIKLISPGFVRTPLTDKNRFAMPFMIEAEQAAKAIADGLRRRGFEIHFPKRFTLLLKLLRLLPYTIALRLTKTIQS